MRLGFGKNSGKNCMLQLTLMLYNTAGSSYRVHPNTLTLVYVD